MKLKVPLGNGFGCRGCGEVFTSLTAFDAHQSWKGGFHCKPPGESAYGKQRLLQGRDGRWYLERVSVDPVSVRRRRKGASS